MKKIFFASLIALFCAACSTHTQYHWGSYEDVLFESSTDTNGLSSKEQIEKLTRDVEKAKELKKLPAPGIHAHLGMIFASEGMTEQARTHFILEKTLYPDSAIFLDRFLQPEPEGENK